MTRFLVWFAGQYGNPDRWVECCVDAHGVWRGPGGHYMPAPKPEHVRPLNGEE